MDWLMNAVWLGLYEVVLGIQAAVVDLVVGTVVGAFSGFLPLV